MLPCISWFLSLRARSPEDQYYKIWRSLVIFSAFCSVWVSPLASAFFSDCTQLLYVDIGFSAVFFVDIILTFLLAFRDETTDLLVFNRERIAWKYVGTWLTLDIMSMIPVMLLHVILPIKNMYIVFYLIRIYRWKTVHSWFNGVEKNLKVNFYLARCIKLLWVVIVNVHTGGCLLYLIATLHHDPQKSWVGGASKDFFQEDFSTKYKTSVYFSMATFATVGYGDLHAVNNAERITTVFYMLWNLGLTGYVIGYFTNLIAHSIGRTHKFRDDLEVASRVCKRNNLTGQLQDRFLAQVTLEHRVNVEALEEQRLFKYLHKPLRLAISLHQYTEVVKNTYLFKRVSTEFLAELVPEMKLLYLPPNEDVVSQHESAQDLYLVISGGLKLINVTNAGEHVVLVVNAGELCGEIDVIFSKPHMFTIRTKQLSRVLRVERNTFLKIVQSRVADGVLIIENFCKKLNTINRVLIPEAVRDIDNFEGIGDWEWFATAGAGGG